MIISNWKNNTNKIQLFTDCIVSNGANRSIIIDLHRNDYDLIPKALANFISEQKTFKSVYDENVGSEEVLDDYFNFLNEKEYLLLVEKKESFSQIDSNFFYPTKIINAIIEFSNESIFDIFKIVNELNALECEDIQLRFYNTPNLEYLHTILDEFENSTIMNIEIYLPFDINVHIYTNLNVKYPRIKQMIIHSSPIDKLLKNDNGVIIIQISQSINNNTHCGYISQNNFDVSILKYTESQLLNSCLNKKISIDKTGEIKNCPALSKSYGNIKDKSLIDVAQDMEFQKTWHIHKDQIKICKDCEFRHICTDCRAFTEDPKDIYSKPLKCGYNPYTNEWQDWSTNPIKYKAIEFYKQRELEK